MAKLPLMHLPHATKDGFALCGRRSPKASVPIMTVPVASFKDVTCAACRDKHMVRIMATLDRPSFNPVY